MSISGILEAYLSRKFCLEILSQVIIGDYKSNIYIYDGFAVKIGPILLLHDIFLKSKVKIKIYFSECVTMLQYSREKFTDFLVKCKCVKKEKDHLEI